LLGDGESRKKKKVGLIRSWKKVLDSLRFTLERASASRFKLVGPGMKFKCGSWARPKPTRVRLDLGSPSVGPRSNPNLISAAVSGANLGPAYSGSFAKRQSFVGWCASAPVVNYPSTMLVVSEVCGLRRLRCLWLILTRLRGLLQHR
jgi:hypothetical protein